jgi:hypothetical protein
VCVKTKSEPWKGSGFCFEVSSKIHPSIKVGRDNVEMDNLKEKKQIKLDMYEYCSFKNGELWQNKPSDFIISIDDKSFKFMKGSWMTRMENKWTKNGLTAQ